MKSKFRIFKKMTGILLIFVCIGIAVLLGISSLVKYKTKDRIITAERAGQIEDVDCIIVLGCKVKDDGSPSHMLEDRLKMGVNVYNLGAPDKIIMSGDHGREHYDEVNAMKKYAVDNGVPSQNVFMDHAGFSTYESMYRAKEIFGAEKVVIVTQEYHLYRSLYIAEKLGLDAYGVASDYRTYAGKLRMEIRELLARSKDFAMSILKPKPTYLGKKISLQASGDITNG